MTRLETFAWCVGLSIIALAWLAVGVPGALCLIAGAIVGNIDLSWIERGEADAITGPATVSEPAKSGVVYSADAGDIDRELTWHPLPFAAEVRKSGRKWWQARKKVAANVVELPVRRKA